MPETMRKNMPHWLQRLRERPEYERRIMAGAIMAVLSMFVFLGWGYSIRQSMNDLPAQIVGNVGETPQEQTMHNGGKTAALEKPASIMGSFIGEIAKRIGRAHLATVHAFDDWRIVRNAFRGLDSLKASDFAEAVFDVPQKWTSATGGFVSRGLAALRATNGDVLDGVARIMALFFE